MTASGLCWRQIAFSRVAFGKCAFYQPTTFWRRSWTEIAHCAFVLVRSPSERASFTDLDVEMGSALARIVAVHLHRQQEQQSSQLAPHYSKEGLLLLLDDKVGAMGSPCCMRKHLCPGLTSVPKMAYFPLGPDIRLCTKITGHHRVEFVSILSLPRARRDGAKDKHFRVVGCFGQC
jgi:hypothetical protein